MISNGSAFVRAISAGLMTVPIYDYNGRVTRGAIASMLRLIKAVDSGARACRPPENVQMLPYIRSHCHSTVQYHLTPKLPVYCSWNGLHSRLRQEEQTLYPTTGTHAQAMVLATISLPIKHSPAFHGERGTMPVCHKHPMLVPQSSRIDKANTVMADIQLHDKRA